MSLEFALLLFCLTLVALVALVSVSKQGDDTATQAIVALKEIMLKLTRWLK